VVVVIGDPPTDRGQLAQPLNLEDISPVEIQLLNRPRKRVTPMECKRSIESASPSRNIST
ncbi:hypothetical protein, partial [Paraburkholderia sp. NMBU_R16]|uniref:hypothetical protein n=1 Tax=Paraburkholderia sp. NMBU_R16 TaxID=2698676 RepID=UPI001C260515